MNADIVFNALHIVDAEIAKSLKERFGSSRPSLNDVNSNVMKMKSPNANFVIEVFIAYLKYLHVDVSTVGVPSHSQGCHLGYPDAYIDTQPYLDLHFILNYIFQRNYIEDFSITDLTNPTQKRTLKQFGILENLTSYFDVNCDDLEEVFHNLAEWKTNYFNMLKRHEELLQQRNNMAKNRVDRGNRVKELEAKIVEKQLAPKDNEAALKVVSDERLHYSGMLQTQKRDADSLKQGIINVTDELANLKKQVVPSPAQLTSDANQRAEKLEELDDHIQMKTSLYKEKQIQVKFHETLITELEEQIKRLGEFKTEQDAELQATREIDRLEKKEAAIADKLAPSQEQNSKLKHEDGQLNEQLVALKLQRENKRIAVDKAINSTKAELQSIDSRLNETNKQFTCLDSEMICVTSEFDSWQEGRDNVIDAINAENTRTYHKAESTIEDYAAFLADDVGKRDEEKRMMLKAEKDRNKKNNK